MHYINAYGYCQQHIYTYLYFFIFIFYKQSLHLSAIFCVFYDSFEQIHRYKFMFI